VNRYIVESEIENVDKTVGTIMKSIITDPIYWFVLIAVFAALAWMEGIKSLVTIIPILLLVVSILFLEIWMRKQSDKSYADCRKAGMISAVALVSLVLSIVLKSILSSDLIEVWPVIAMLSFLAIRFFFKYRKASRQLAERQNSV
jgi:hypothetical protein